MTGQRHQFSGERGRTVIEGVTYEALYVTVQRAIFLSSSLPEEDWPDSIYDLNLDEMDPIAIAQNTCVEIEKAQGIFPNVGP